MVTPGLLPEASDRRISPWPFTLVFLGIALLAGMVYLAAQVAALRTERTKQAKELARLRAELVNREEREKALAAEVHRADAERRQETIVTSGVLPEPSRAPDLRVVPAVPREQAQERIAQGLHEFRSGRYLQAELAFLRAVPEAYGYVALTCFVRGEVREAVAYLGRALAADPEWLRRIRPRDLFGDPAEYEKALRALEERVAADPLDAEAKTFLAYLYAHEKGPEYAKALLVEALNARPDHAEARQLQDALR